MCSRRVRALLEARQNKVWALLGARRKKWLALALVACGLASACSQYNTNLSIQTSSSAVTFLSPGAAVAGGQGFTITVNGVGFVTGAIVLWNVGPGQKPTQLVTTLVSNVQLTAPVPASLITSAGTVQVAVQIPGSAVAGSSNSGATTTTEVSNVVYFSISSAPGPAPTVTSLSASATSTSQAFTPFCSAAGITLNVYGTNFVNDSKVNNLTVSKSTVYWNGSARPTSFVSATQLTALISATDTAFPGTATVSVFNDAATSFPGTSNGLPFTMVTAALGTPGTPTLSQTSAAVGASALTLTVTGGNILPCSVAQWVDSKNVTTALPTTYIATAGGAASLSITIPSTDFAASGTANIQVTNLVPGGASSGKVAFAISPPAISAVTSSSAAACSPSGVTLVVTGTNFVSSSVVNWNGSPRVTTFVNSMQLTALLTPADAAFPSANPSTDMVSVTSNSDVSNNKIFSVAASGVLLLPSIAPGTLMPAQATAGTAALTVSLSGSNFLPCSVVQWNNGIKTTTLPTTFNSAAQQLTAVVPAADILIADVPPNVATQITVFNPMTGGGGGSSTPPIAFPIVAPTVKSLSASTTLANSAPSCGYSGLTLTVTGTNFVNGLVVNWNGSPRPTTFVSATQLSAAISPADSAFPGTANVTVSSSTITSNSATFTLTAPASLPTPTIVSPFAPSSAVAGDPAFLLGTSGTGWAPCTLIQWNGSAAANNRTALFVGTTGASAVISADDIASAGTVPVTAVNPAPGGGTSAAALYPIFATPGQSTGTASAAGSLATPYKSANGRYSVFVLASTDGVTEKPGTTQNIFVYDACTGVATGCTAGPALVSVGIGNASDGNSISPAISADGRYITFISSATNLVAGDANGFADVFVRDTCAGASNCTPSTQLVSVATKALNAVNAVQANADSTSATINADGRYITFRSAATKLDLASTATTGLFLRDTCAGVTGCTPTTQQLQ